MRPATGDGRRTVVGDEARSAPVLVPVPSGERLFINYHEGHDDHGHDDDNHDED
ncbi:MAG: hypothetical protein IPL61_37600 [Myxococcales bacterium]|nr:hypothetical protein [Myxococcales bacterium]